MTTKDKSPDPAPVPPPGLELPLELVQALVSQPDPYAQLGREYLRRMQLENIVAEMQKFLASLAGKVTPK
jgi:hypothetical protein